jgi:osmotically-inducible protein OsmY
MRPIKLIQLFAFGVLLMGCVPMLDATTDGPINPDPGKRDLGQYFSDEKLETVIALNLRKAHPELAGSHVNVLCFNNVVLLTGEVPSNEMKQLASKTARKISQVRQVHNELLIQTNTTFFSRRNDNWLATKIRSKLIADGSVKIERVKVVVENGVVFLMGLVNRKEAETISQTAASVSGVDKVVRAFEYIDQ